MTPKSYTFNKPIVALFFLPLLVVILLLFYSLAHAFNFFALLMLLLSLLLLGTAVRWAFLRRLRIHSGGFEWREPGRRFSITPAAVTHFGEIRFRSFRFIFVTSEESSPFADPARSVVPGNRLFLIQYRPAAWEAMQALIRQAQPALEPETFKRN